MPLGIAKTNAAQPYDPLWPYVTFLVQPLAGATSYTVDEKGNALTLNGAVYVDGAVGAFPGGASLVFDGASQINHTNTVFTNLNGVAEYTIEMLIRVDNNFDYTYKDFLGCDASGSANAVNFGTDVNGYMSMHDWGAGNFPALTENYAIWNNPNSILYYAYKKSGLNGYLYRNTAIPNVSRTYSTEPMWYGVAAGGIFGRPGNTAMCVKGRLFGARITAGVDRPIVVPTAPWPNR